MTLAPIMKTTEIYITDIHHNTYGNYLIQNRCVVIDKIIQYFYLLRKIILGLII